MVKGSFPTVLSSFKLTFSTPQARNLVCTTLHNIVQSYMAISWPKDISVQMFNTENPLLLSPCNDWPQEVSDGIWGTDGNTMTVMTIIMASGLYLVDNRLQQCDFPT